MSDTFQKCYYSPRQASRAGYNYAEDENGNIFKYSERADVDVDVLGKTRFEDMRFVGMGRWIPRHVAKRKEIWKRWFSSA
jgi:hypothetical protein